MLAKRTTELDGTWLTHLDPVIKAYNKLDHSALHGNAPGEVKGNDELRFQLRMENANGTFENAQMANARREKLAEKGAFRTCCSRSPLSVGRVCLIGATTYIRLNQYQTVSYAIRRVQHTTLDLYYQLLPRAHLRNLSRVVRNPATIDAGQILESFCNH